MFVIVWRGRGAAVLLFLAAGWLVGDGIGEGVAGAHGALNLGTAAGLVAAGVALWFVGRHLNRPGQRYNERTASWYENRDRHRFFFVPMQYWGVVLVVLGIAMAVAAVAR